MKIIKHENIVKLIEVLASKTKIYLIMELVNGSDLLKYVSNFCISKFC